MIIAIANLKGGVGKTTIAVNICAALDGLLIDADIQGTATEWEAVPTHHWPIETLNDAKEWMKNVKKLNNPYTIIDCPPQIGATTNASFLLCDLALIPCGASAADIRASAKVLSLLKEAQKLRQGPPKVLLIPSKRDSRTASGRELEEVLRGFNEMVGPSIGLRTDFADSIGSGTWIGEYAPKSKAHDEILSLVDIIKKNE
jgi:chromosome partitioning protein